MNYKQDELYCWVRKDKIKTARPILNQKVIKQWFYHQKERTNIYYKKEILKQKPPFTNDEILQKYKFVNTKRTWDRQSKWLIENIIENNSINYENKLLHCFLFRVINKSETLELLGWFIDFKNINIGTINKKYRKILEEKSIQDPDYVFFSAAYILWGPKVNFWKYIEKIEWKEEKNMVLRMIKYVYYNQEQIIKWIEKSKNQKEVCDFLSTFWWIWNFLSYQIFIDFTYIKEFRFTEHNFVISGPGCERGIDWIFKNRDGMTSEECLFWFVENQDNIAKLYNIDWELDMIFHFLPKSQRFYTLMDMENSWACEIDKRCRTLFDNKRPKQLFKS